MASNKSFVIGGLAALVAAGLMVGFLLFDSSDKTATGDTDKPAVVNKPPQPKTEDKPIATAEDIRTPVRTDAGTPGAPTNATGGVEGVVVDTTNQPIIGAKVELLKIPAGSGRLGMSLVQLQKSRFADAPKMEVYSSVSGADGKYKITAPPGDQWKLIASHPDFARVEHGNISTPSDSYFTFPLTMRGGIRLYGRVTEVVKNMPIIGAVVVLDDEPPLGGFNTSTNERRETVTDSSGGFKFENTTPGRHSITFKAITYGTKFFPVVSVTENLENPTFRHDATMNPGFNISGRVLDARGSYIPDAKVKATTAAGALGGSFGDAVTNQNGEFVIKDLEEGRYFLIADAGLLGQGRPDPPQQSIATGTTDVEIRLAPQCGVQGTVRDKATNKPLANFKVEVRRGGPGQKVFPREIPAIAFKDRRDGSFEVQGLQSNSQQYVLYVSADGFASSYSEPFTVQPEQVTRGINVSLGVGGTIRGQLVDGKNKQPVANATIRTRDNDFRDVSAVLPFFGEMMASQPQKAPDITVVTDADGKFEIKNVEEGIIKLQITHPRFIPTNHADCNVFDGKVYDTGQIHLASGSVVKGTVTLANGAPAANAEVTIRPSGGVRKDFTFFTKQVRCDAQGKYTIPNVPAGDYSIWAIEARAGNAAPGPFEGIVLQKKSLRPIILGESQDQEVDLYIAP
ncbi:MAG: carboxypeptidase regulatory-like domain-containing protein [Planctomycetota bacterium]